MKKFVYLFCFIGFFEGITSSQPLWTSNNLTFVDHVAYFTELMQETVYELEKYGWWNLKMINYTQTIKQTIYDWNFEATATYHDGFLMSIERIDLRDIRQRFDTNSTTQEITGTISGMLNFHEVTVGHDVIVVMPDETKKYTGTFSYRKHDYAIEIHKNLHTNIVEVSSRLYSTQRGDFGMKILPYDKVAQLLGRHYLHLDHNNSFRAWSTNLLLPILRLAITKIQIPNHCFNCEQGST